MSAPIGQRSYRLMLFSASCGTFLYAMALWVIKGTEVKDIPASVFIGIGVSIGLMFALLTTPGMGKTAIEWWARSKDQSTIVDQMKEDKKKPDEEAK